MSLVMISHNNYFCKYLFYLSILYRTISNIFNVKNVPLKSQESLKDT